MFLLYNILILTRSNQWLVKYVRFRSGSEWQPISHFNIECIKCTTTQNHSVFNGLSDSWDHLAIRQLSTQINNLLWNQFLREQTVQSVNRMGHFEAEMVLQNLPKLLRAILKKFSPGTRMTLITYSNRRQNGNRRPNQPNQRSLLVGYTGQLTD